MRKLLLGALTLLSTTTAFAGDYVPTIWGNVIEMTSWDAMSEYSKPVGVYSFQASPENFKFTQVTPTSSNFYPTGNGIIANGEYNFMVYAFDDWYYEYYTQLYTYDVKTWTLKNPPKDVADNFRAFDMAQDPTDGTIYGYFVGNRNNIEFGTVDFSQPKRTTIAESDTAYYALACSNEGQLYAVSLGGNLWKVAKNGDVEKVGSLGLEEQQLTIQDRVQSATFDPKTNKMYWSAYLWDAKNIEYKTALYEIDTTTGLATKVVDFPDQAQVVALHIEAPEAEDAAPAAATELSTSFEGASLSGKVEFTAPTLTYSGDELSGDINYEVLVAGEVLAQGTCKAGEKVSADVTVKSAGNTTFIVQTSNEAGKSPKAEVEKWISYDETTAPKNVKADLDENKVTLTWEAPEKAVHDGYYDAANVTYTVVRTPGNVVVAENTTDLSATDELPTESYKQYTYSVVANNDAMKSEAGVSNAVVAGPTYEIPYTEDFANKSKFEQFTVIDANGDKKYEESWGYVMTQEGYWDYSSSKKAAMFYAGDKDADDWLITPGIRLEKGVSYVLKFDSRRDVERYEEKLAIAFGKGINPANYTVVNTGIKPAYPNFETTEVTFTAPEDGVYHIGFHEISPKRLSYVWLTNINLDKNTETGINSIENENRNAVRYNLSGQKVGKNYKGVVIVNGKKVMQ